jgi:hypothetical protein
MHNGGRFFGLHKENNTGLYKGVVLEKTNSNVVVVVCCYCFKKDEFECCLFVCLFVCCRLYLVYAMSQIIVVHGESIEFL